jgi:regulation of enolase protein 1 (concanavalin A-like superfamily)
MPYRPQPGGAVGNSYDLALYPGELSLISDAGTYPSSFPMLIYPFQGNFQAAVRLDFQTDGPHYHGAGIGLRAAQDQSIGDWVFLMSHFRGEGLGISSGFLEPENLTRVSYANSIVYLRITKQGTLFSAEYSTDGANWVTLVSNSVISLPSDVEIFLYTYSTNGEGVIARFSEFSIVAR